MSPWIFHELLNFFLPHLLSWVEGWPGIRMGTAIQLPKQRSESHSFFPPFLIPLPFPKSTLSPQEPFEFIPSIHPSFCHCLYHFPPRLLQSFLTSVPTFSFSPCQSSCYGYICIWPTLSMLFHFKIFLCLLISDWIKFKLSNIVYVILFIFFNLVITCLSFQFYAWLLLHRKPTLVTPKLLQ